MDYGALTPDQIAAAQGLFSPAPTVAAPISGGGGQGPLASGFAPMAPDQSSMAPPAAQMSAEPSAPFRGAPFAPDAPAPQWSMADAAGSHFMPPAGTRPITSFQRDNPGPAAPVGTISNGSMSGGAGKLAADVKSAQKGVLEANVGQQQAEANAAVAEQGKNTAMAGVYDAHAQREQQTAEIQHNEAKQAQQTHADYLAKSQAMTDKIAKEEIDPQRFIHSKSIGERILFALGGALGGLGSAITGGPNHFMNALDGLIKADIDGQKHNIDLKHKAIDARKSQYGQMREAFGDKTLADQQYAMGAREAAKNQVLAMAATSSNPVVKANAEKTIAALDEANKQTQLAFAKTAQQTALAQAAASAAAAHARAEQEFQHNLAGAKLKLEQQDADTRRLEAGGKGAGKLDAQTAEYAKELEKAGLPKAEAEISALKKGLPQPGQDIPGMGLKADAIASIPGGERFLMGSGERINRNNIAQLALAYRNAVTGSGGSAKEMEQIEKAFYGIKTPEELWSAIAKADATVAARKGNLQAGYGPEVTNRYEGNLQSTAAAPLSSEKPGLSK